MCPTRGGRVSVGCQKATPDGSATLPTMSRPTRLRQLLFGPLLLLWVGCAPKLPPPETSSPTPSAISIPSAAEVAQPKFDPQKYTTMNTALNSFGQRLFTEVAKSHEGNLAVSPVGPFVLLELLREGAEGETKTELTKVLGGETGLPRKRPISCGFSIRAHLSRWRRKSSWTRPPRFEVSILRPSTRV